MANRNYLFQRDCGILLHPTSLPNDYGVGDFGPSAIRWVDFLAVNGQNLWQILPLNPAGYGDSPYQGLSAFAANPVFLSPESVFAEGLISRELLLSLKIPPGSEVDYARVYANKSALSKTAADAFFKLEASHPLREAYEVFLENEAEWIDDFACFYALKNSFGGVAWTDWPEPFRDRKPEALEQARSTLKKEIARAKLEQFLLRQQWDAVRAAASNRGRSNRWRPTYIRRARQRRRVVPKRFVSARKGRSPIGCGRRAARLFFRNRTALGEPALRLGKAP